MEGGGVKDSLAPTDFFENVVYVSLVVNSSDNNLRGKLFLSFKT